MTETLARASTAGDGSTGAADAGVGAGAASGPALMADAARRWLLHSGVRTTQRQSLAGGLRRGYLPRAGGWLGCYPEITAYAVQFHLRWQDAVGARRDEDLAAATESGAWLLARQAQGGAAAGAFPYECGESGVPGVDGAASAAATGGYYTFDTAIAGHALLDLWRATGRLEFRTAAERAARWVLARQHAEGSFAACLGEPHVSWAGDRACLHGKHALLLLAWERASGDPHWGAAARKLLDWLLTLQDEHGGVRVRAGQPWIFLHAHCYAAEGLLAGALRWGEPYQGAALRAAQFLAACQGRDGSVPRYHGAARAYLAESGARWPLLRAWCVPRDVGATAQAGRIWVWADQLTRARRFAPQVDRALGWLVRHQLRSADVRIDGALPAARDPLRPWDPLEWRFYPWVAVFAADLARLSAAPSLNLF